jgi:hypothetical protein
MLYDLGYEQDMHKHPFVQDTNRVDKAHIDGHGIHDLQKVCKFGHRYQTSGVHTCTSYAPARNVQ